MELLKWLYHFCNHLIAMNPCTSIFSYVDKHRNCGCKPRLKSGSDHHTGTHRSLCAVQPKRRIVGEWGRDVRGKDAQCLVGSTQRPPSPSPLGVGGAMPPRVPPWHPTAAGNRTSILLQHTELPLECVYIYIYTVKSFNITSSKSQTFNVCCFVMQLSLPNPAIEAGY